ncbi:unnamed protein product [Polarella glacialis]|uniref:Transmembrane protein n=1 Tax=Polarella glacialis TaxID=89957 RepID=A0A813DMV2_POLGL|nr:unnamed protein product [Polarella glacialis]
MKCLFALLKPWVLAVACFTWASVSAQQSFSRGSPASPRSTDAADCSNNHHNNKNNSNNNLWAVGQSFAGSWSGLPQAAAREESHQAASPSITLRPSLPVMPKYSPPSGDFWGCSSGICKDSPYAGADVRGPALQGGEAEGPLAAATGPMEQQQFLKIKSSLLGWHTGSKVSSVLPIAAATGGPSCKLLAAIASAAFLSGSCLLALYARQQGGPSSPVHSSGGSLAIALREAVLRARALLNVSSTSAPVEVVSADVLRTNAMPEYGQPPSLEHPCCPTTQEVWIQHLPQQALSLQFQAEPKVELVDVPTDVPEGDESMSDVSSEAAGGQEQDFASKPEVEVLPLASDTTFLRSLNKSNAVLAAQVVALGKGAFWADKDGIGHEEGRASGSPAALRARCRVCMLLREERPQVPQREQACCISGPPPPWFRAPVASPPGPSCAGPSSWGSGLGANLPLCPSHISGLLRGVWLPCSCGERSFLER